MERVSRRKALILIIAAGAVACVPIASENIQTRRRVGGLGLFLPTETTSDLTTRKLYYPKEKFLRNRIVAFGDSNISGAEVGGLSPPHAAKELAESKGAVNWEIMNYALNGSTTKEIIEEQILRPGIIRHLAGKPFELWANFGGNDISRVVDSEEKAAEAGGLLKNPFNIRTLIYLYRLYQEMSQSFGRFQDLFDAAHSEYSESVLTGVILGPPNFTKPKAISSYINGRKHFLELDHPIAIRLAYNLSATLRNQIIKATESYLKKHPKRQIIIIDTFDFEREDFGDDQHFNKRGVRRIAQNYFDRLEVVA